MPTNHGNYKDDRYRPGLDSSSRRVREDEFDANTPRPKWSNELSFVPGRRRALDAHDPQTQARIREHKQLEMLMHGPKLIRLVEDWHWIDRMKGVQEKQEHLERMILAVRRDRVANEHILVFLLIALEPVRRAVSKQFMELRSGLDPASQDEPSSWLHRGEARLVEHLDREALYDVTRFAVLNAIYHYPADCQRLFPWFQETIAHRALDQLRSELSQYEWRGIAAGEAEAPASESIRFRDASGTWSVWATADGSVETSRSGPLTVQLRFVDGVGNTVDLAPTTVAIDNPDISSDVPDPVDLADDNCAAVYSATYCADASQDDPQDSTVSAVAAAAAPSTDWGLADSDRAYLGNTNPDPNSLPKSYLSSSIVNDLDEGGQLNNVRLLVAYNIMDKTGSLWKFPNRRIAFLKALNAATDKGNVLISFEAGCRTDDTNMACSGQVNRDDYLKRQTLYNKFPAEQAVNNTAKRIYQSVPAAVGDKIKWIGVWNEPTNANQPLRQSGGLKRLQRLTRELVRPAGQAKPGGGTYPKGTCRTYGCRIVTAEVEVVQSSKPQNPLTNDYGAWLKVFKRDEPTLAN